jgi:glycosyltransferase involved in cell wall biosynthesis
VLTVGIVNESNLVRKGLTTFVEAARLLPEIPFVLVGPWEEHAVGRLRARAPANLEITGWLPDDELRARMAAAGVYVQASLHEAFGVAVAEAMLSGCVPVVTPRGSLPEIVGDTGFYVPVADPAAAAHAIRAALASPDNGALARARILARFPPALRRERLLAALGRGLAGEDGSP